MSSTTSAVSNTVAAITNNTTVTASASAAAAAANFKLSVAARTKWAERVRNTTAGLKPKRAASHACVSSTMTAVSEAAQRVRAFKEAKEASNSSKLPTSSLTKSTVIPGFAGDVYVRDVTDDYNLHAYQYAKTSYYNPDLLRPALIAYATGDSDVQAAILYAASRGAAVAVRCGGHQYSGFSSADNKNIILDLGQTYATPSDFIYDPVTNQVTVGVSYDLEMLTEIFIGIYEQTGLALFLPHGACKAVQVGGHVQTGGYGMMLRSFGMFADYVVSFDMFDATGTKHTITKVGNPQLFAAVLGGGVGNYGVLTHVTFQPLIANEYPNSCGLVAFTLYDPTVLQQLMSIYANMVNNDEYSGDYDILISAISGQDKSETNLTYDDWMRINHPEIYGVDEMDPSQLLYPLIQIGIQYAGRNDPSQPYDPTLFNAVRAVLPAETTLYALDETSPTSLTLLSYAWLFLNIREYDMPYIKRCYMFNDQLDAVNFPTWLAEQSTAVVAQDPNNIKLVMQAGFGGGNNSAMRNPTGPAAGANTYDWRHTSRGSIVFDVFYRDSDYQKVAATTQAASDVGFAAQTGFTNNRMVWCTFLKHGENYNMQDPNTWGLYYLPQTFSKLKFIKSQYDPYGVFSPHQFAIPSQWFGKEGEQGEKKEEEEGEEAKKSAAAGRWWPW